MAVSVVTGFFALKRLDKLQKSIQANLQEALDATSDTLYAEPLAKKSNLNVK